jgi:hypothetical protein
MSVHRKSSIYSYDNHVQSDQCLFGNASIIFGNVTIRFIFVKSISNVVVQHRTYNRDLFPSFFSSHHPIKFESMGQNLNNSIISELFLLQSSTTVTMFRDVFQSKTTYYSFSSTTTYPNVCTSNS